MTPTSSHKGSVKIFNHNKGDIINRRNGTITSNKDQMLESPDIKDNSRESPDLNIQLFNQDEHSGIKTEDALIDTKRSHHVRFKTISDGKIDDTPESERQTLNNGVTVDDIDFKEKQEFEK